LFVKNAEDYIEICTPPMNLAITLDCGQAFRWRQNEDASWTGVVRGIEVKISETENGLRFHGIDENTFNNVFFDYFDFGRDYEGILSSFAADRHLEQAIKSYGTIRILRQEPWEALCSFIISACNNIP
jgi:N-glycosylase/DNA lyase